jgi:hypothetical protein
MIHACNLSYTGILHEKLQKGIGVCMRVQGMIVRYRECVDCFLQGKDTHQQQQQQQLQGANTG